MEYKFTIPGKPGTKQRPRMGQGYTYTPKETIYYENLVKVSYQDQVHTFLEGPIAAEIKCFYEPPKSASNKKRQQMLSGEIKYTKKNDLDNSAKTILDALNNVAYHDDAQIYDMHVTKAYAEVPRVEVKLQTI